MCVHCFTGGRAELLEYVRRGFRIGFTGCICDAKVGAAAARGVTAPGPTAVGTRGGFRGEPHGRGVALHADGRVFGGAWAGGCPLMALRWPRGGGAFR